MNNELFFSDMTLDRKTSDRKSSSWLLSMLAANKSKFIPIWQGRYFFCQLEYVHFLGKECFAEISHVLTDDCYFLGVDKTEHDQGIFVVDLSTCFAEETDVVAFIRSVKHFDNEVNQYDFRQSLAYLTDEQAAILGYGRSLVNWHQSSQYCGFCGSKTSPIEGGHSRQCKNEHCLKQSFPRTDPVVIMLVEYQQIGQPNKCLLAEHQRSAERLVSTLAGFVDPGESLVQAVKREVFEESGVTVDEVKYMASQPWPFPNSLMIGFHARATSNSIVIDEDELRNAHWYTAEEVASFSDWGENDDNIQIPKKQSIARYLIDTWLDENQPCK